MAEMNLQKYEGLTMFVCPMFGVSVVICVFLTIRGVYGGNKQYFRRAGWRCGLRRVSLWV